MFLFEECFNTLRPRQNGRHFADDIFKCIFLNENIWISIQISLKFVPKGPINNIPALVQIMAWRRLGDKPLSEPMIVYWRIYASLGFDELIPYGVYDLTKIDKYQKWKFILYICYIVVHFSLIYMLPYTCGWSVFLQLQSIFKLPNSGMKITVSQYFNSIFIQVLFLWIPGKHTT